MTRPASFPSWLVAAGFCALTLPLGASGRPWRPAPAAPAAGAPLTDLCSFEGDNSGVGSAPVCDPFTECDIDRYSCTLSARSGFFEPMHQTFCGSCQSPRGVARHAVEPAPAALSPVAGPDGGLERVSVGLGNAEANGGSLTPTLSDDGRYVVFDSAAANLVANDLNARRDVFLFDRVTRQTDRVSVAGNGAEGNGHSIAGAVSADGNTIVFLSVASNLVTGDSNTRGDVFVRDRQLGTTTRVNVGPGGIEATGTSTWWGGANGSWPVSSPDTLDYEQRIADNTETAISADGRYVAFVSDATNLVAGDTNNVPDVFVHDRQNGATTRVSLTNAGAQLVHGAGTDALMRPHVAISADGRFVAFTTNYPAVPSDTNDKSDVYVRDRLLAQTTRVSVSSSGAEGNAFSGWPSVSGDGRFVAFASDATTLVAGADSQRDVYVHDRQTGETRRASTNTAPGFFDRAVAPAISRDGRWVVYARPLSGQAFMFDVRTGALHTISRAGVAAAANAVTLGASVNADGSVVAFASPAGNLTGNDGNGADDIFVAPGNLVYNGGFAGGETYWQVFDPNGGIVRTVINGAMHFYRTGSQAVVFQSTSARIPFGVPVEASFDVANTSNVRKRISVLIHDSDFSDLSVCTFWLPAGAPSRTYAVRMHTTRPWLNATVSFYAATVGSDGGFYVLDNVLMRTVPGASPARTDCFDPLTPPPAGGGPGGNLLNNGGFAAGLTPWLLFGQIVAQVSAGVLEFYRPFGLPSGVVFQNTNQPAAANQLLTATFQMGNSSGVRKRVTVLLHDANFSDLSACTFWLAPGQPLSPYLMRTYATAAWSNATLSIYPSTLGVDPWTRVDDVTMQVTPGAAIAGTECVEPGGERPTAAVVVVAGAAPHSGERLARRMMLSSEIVDLRDAALAHLSFESWMPDPGSAGVVEVSDDDGNWTIAAVVGPSETWTPIRIDLSAFAGRVLMVRFVPLADPDAPSPTWRIDRIQIVTGRVPPR